MKYLIFTYPNCPKCDSLKRELKKSGLKGQECNLAEKESKIKIRNYLKDIKRDEKGGIVIPVVLIIEHEKVRKVITTSQELKDWLQSED